MPDQLPRPPDKDEAATNPPQPPDDSAPKDPIFVVEESTEDTSIPLVLPLDAAIKAYPAEQPLPPRAPRPPHPGFWFAFLWCIAFQVLQLLVGIAVAIVIAIGLTIASNG